ncbi:MAG: alanine--tRNA ligase [Gammaproteobacteria bacterium]|nr:alanine--tRNA ligase [Gammaproteobacteria bacterium]
MNSLHTDSNVKNSSTELRQSFLDYFHNLGHEVVASSPLVPANDPTLLFTNAGMVQFKEVFLGLDQRACKRAVSSQRCLRAGGKHNDLEQVGYTARHHTCFEMLGNFSFGDYFKHDAIRYAWEFLTGVLKLAPERLWVTVYEQDNEAADIWLKEMKIDPQRFSRCGEKDNFWSMGDTGPCGPCSEIFYDHGAHIAGGPPGSPDADGDRYVEIWNLVFMQYERSADGTLNPLPHPSVDTGMGLERLAAVMQGVHSNYEIDLFQSLMQAAAKLAGVSDLNNSSLRVISDHIRACSFLVLDGVTPANEGRGYVLRRIIRRALRHGSKLGLKESFFHKLVAPLVKEMGAAYPDLPKNRERIERVLRQEEERFAETLEQGLHILEQDIARMSGSVIGGEIVFRLYDTYGFPVDLTADIARERGLTLDMAGFELAMEEQRTRARAASHFEVDYTDKIEIDADTEFTGYEALNGAGRVLAIYREGATVSELNAGETGMVILDRTPFYAESGGQVGDRGILRNKDMLFEVSDTRKQGAAHGHFGSVKSGRVYSGDTVSAHVNAETRQATMLNHSATHLMHAALRRILGDHVTQKGSLVGPERLRFDFSHSEPLTQAQIHDIERLVNAHICANHEAETRIMARDDAMKSGAMALFGEKYSDQVRVLRFADFSTELCGGTHVRRSGDIGLFKIIAEGGVASGVRRIEAVTGTRALAWIKETERRLSEIAGLLKAGHDTAEDKLRQLLDKSRRLEKELEHLKAKFASVQGSDIADQAEQINGIKVLAARLDGADSKSLRDTVDQLKNKLGSAAVVLAAVADGKVSLVAGVTADYSQRIKAGELVNLVASQVGGKGGGRADMAQAGGTNPAALDSALKSVSSWVRKQLG